MIFNPVKWVGVKEIETMCTVKRMSCFLILKTGQFSELLLLGLTCLRRVSLLVCEEKLGGGFLEVPRGASFSIAGPTAS